MARNNIYEHEQKGMVSIWVATVPLASIPEGYFKEHYGDGADEPFNQFSEDFGFGFHDNDFVDTNAVTDRPKTCERLIGECSYSASFVAEATTDAERLGRENSEFVFLMYDVEYRPKNGSRHHSPYMVFLGSYRYDKSSPNKFSFEG
jgi:hypothetical protein